MKKLFRLVIILRDQFFKFSEPIVHLLEIDDELNIIEILAALTYIKRSRIAGNEGESV